MRKLLYSIIILAGLLTSGVASARLVDYYQSKGLSMPSVARRAVIASAYGIKSYSGTYEQNVALEGFLRSEEGLILGSTLPVAGVTYNLAGSGVTASATSIVLKSLTIPQTGYLLQDSDFSTTFYLTFQPGNTKSQEIASCTTVTQNANGSATLSGCTRGLLPFSPFTASSTFRFPHAGGTQVIFSDPPQLFNEFTAKQNNELVTGQWQFVQLPTSTTSTPTDQGQFITLYQFSQATSTGGVNQTTTVKGVSQSATDAQLQLGTVFGSTGAVLGATSQSFNQTSTANKVPVSNGSGKIDTSWINTSTNFVWTGQNTFTATTTFATNSVNASIVVTSSITNLNVITNLTSQTTTILNKAASNIPYLLFSTSTDYTVGNRSDEAPIVPTTTIPAGVLSTSTVIRVYAPISDFALNSGNNFAFRLKLGSTNIVSSTSGGASGSVDLYGGHIECILVAIGVNSQEATCEIVLLRNTNSFPVTAETSYLRAKSSTATENSNTALPLTLTAQYTSANSAAALTVPTSIIEVLR